MDRKKTIIQKILQSKILDPNPTSPDQIGIETWILEMILECEDGMGKHSSAPLAITNIPTH